MLFSLFPSNRRRTHNIADPTDNIEKLNKAIPKIKIKENSNNIREIYSPKFNIPEILRYVSPLNVTFS